MDPTLSEPLNEVPTTLPTATETQVAAKDATNAHVDPITGEANAHPVEVGVGALGAGAAGAALGSVLGPVGIVAGAVVGGLVGALVGKEVAGSDETPMSSVGGATSTEPGQPASAAALDVPPAVPRTQPDDELLAPTAPVLPSAHETRADSVDLTGSPIAADETATEVRPFVVDESLNASYDRQPTDIAPTSPTDIPASPVDAALASPTRPAEGSVSDEAIRIAAYYRYLDRQTTGEHGDEASDWEHARKNVGA